MHHLSNNEAPAANDYVEADLVLEWSDSVRIFHRVKHIFVAVVRTATQVIMRTQTWTEFAWKD